MTAPETPEKPGGYTLAAILGTGGGASTVGVAAILWESFKADKCAEVLMAQTASYEELLKAMIEHLAK